MGVVFGYPPIVLWPGGLAPSISSHTLNQATDAIEIVWQPPEPGTYTRFGVRQGVALGTVPAIKASIQGVDGSGNPDGTVIGGGSPVSKVWTPSAANDNTFYWQDFDNPFVTTTCEPVVLVIKHDSGTIDGSNNCSFGITSDIAMNPGIPYAIQNENGSRSRQVASPLFGIGTATQAHGLPAVSATSGSGPFSSASVPDERGVLFNMPTWLYSTYKVVGLIVHGTWTGGGTVDIVLYDTDGSSVLLSKTFDMDVERSPAVTRSRRLYFGGTAPTLSAGSAYRATVRPGASSVVVNRFAVANDADMDAYPYGGEIARSTVRTDGGAWTDDIKTRYAVDLIVSDLAPGGGAGGMVRHPGMAGGAVG